MTLRLADLDFEVPPHLIAQKPIHPRSHCRLLVLDRRTGQLEHRRFSDLPTILKPGDGFIVNSSAVVPARIPATTMAGRPVELFYVRRIGEQSALFMVKPGRRAQQGVRLSLGEGFEVTIREIDADGFRRVDTPVSIDTVLERFGKTPLPPYIHPNAGSTKSDYHTCFQQEGESIAAPTAGLHFDAELVDRMKSLYFWGDIRLDVGLGTFKPIQTENPLEHPIHAERYYVPKTTGETIRAIRAAGGRVFACGTTVTRVLETLGEKILDGETFGETRIFIHPPYRFKMVDGLLTNFHFPRSTLLLLVWAFAGREFVETAYREAIAQGYRFFSFGDAMLIL